VRKLGGNIARILYEKTKEHPAKRFSQYWDIPEFLLIYAYNDIFIDGKGKGYTITRLNACCGLIERSIGSDRFDNFIVAGKKYMLWQEKVSRKRQNTLLISKSLAESADFSRKNPDQGYGPDRKR
jgi:hypothetical protein